MNQPINQSSSNVPSPPPPPEAKPSSSSSPPLAESFLAIAKDCRYVALATHLIMQILEGWNPRHSSQSQSALAVDAWYASALLYSILVLRRKTKTLGMDITGLRYKERILATTMSSSIWLRSIVGLSTLYILHRWTRPRTDDSTNNNSNHVISRTNNDLRGSERQEAFRNRQRAMIERAQQQQEQGYSNNNNNASSSTANTNGTSSGQQDASENDSGNSGRHTTTALSQLQEELRKGCQRLLEYFMMFQTGGPHDLPAHQFVSSATWCLKLYAAYYCLVAVDGGRFFPSLGHYLLQHEVDVKTNNQQRLVNRPQSHRLVALLILSHGVGVASQKVLTLLMSWLVKRTSTTSSRNNTIRIVGSTTSSIEQQPPLSSSGICAICQQPRKHPACMVQCGHVFCWSCLQKWIAFRAECPVCRKPSRPQDVLALYNYQVPEGHTMEE